MFQLLGCSVWLNGVLIGQMSKMAGNSLVAGSILEHKGSAKTNTPEVGLY